MKKQLIAALITTTILTASVAHGAEVDAFAEEKEQSTLIGLGSGVLLGAVVAGPVGAIIGAVTGGFIGQSVADEAQIASLQTQLEQDQTQIALLTQEKQSLKSQVGQTAQLKQELQLLKQRQSMQFEELALGLNVQFKTGSSEVEPHFQEQLDDIAEVMLMLPKLKLDLTGYADRRGDSNYNQALSEQRVAEVRSYLEQQGVERARLAAKAYGASLPVKTEQSMENDFFDRRVTIKLLPQETELVAN
ncbi:sortase-associated OmpA-like protein PdsO [Shewanella sp. AS1]|uniref:sortase-associated OmpA-like protein PdsO n=1 Tax=Shewanella sp. AS1 TaxID=2907626 RepID=UPI001F2B8752|nr:sortase-associated OmpA-like protein PdsO [Shewanella sp. AS1]MCE9678872.1 sortase-associated OmpA-like protein PdsO [Shewanella sp. AS1]